MNNLTIKIDKQEFLQKPEAERSYITYSVVQDLQERVVKIEKKSWINKGQSFAGGILGGALVMIGKLMLWK